MSYIGTTKIGKMYLGDTEIAKAYLGTNLVFQKGGQPQPVVNIPYIRGGADGSYINTGIIPDSTTKVIIWARNWSSGGGIIIGTRNGANVQNFFLAANKGTASKITVGNGSTSYTGDGEQIRYFSSYHKYELNGLNLSVDDEAVITGTSATLSCSYPLHLLGLNSAGTHANCNFPIDICACKIYKSGALVRDFTPVESPSVGLYDAVSDTVFTNAGNGSFTYGTFNPNAYTPLEYITCTANQYIDSGVSGGYSLNIFAKVSASATSPRWNVPVSARYTTSTRCEFFYGDTTTANNSIAAGYVNSTSQITQSALANIELVLSKYNNVFSIFRSGSQVGTTYNGSTSTTYTSGQTCIIGGTFQSGSFVQAQAFEGNIYYVSLGTKAFVPAKVNNVAGLYETYSDMFYPSESGTAFIAGPQRATKTHYFRNKKISIIGDSISTYNATGYKYDSYSMYYPSGDVDSVDETYWKMLMDYENATLEVNLSYSGSRTTNTDSSKPSLCDRTSLIGNCDVVIIAMGTNDSTNNVSLGNYSYDTATSSLSEATFRDAYIKGIKQIKEANPNVDIVCLILQMKDAYVQSIRTIASHYNLKVVECVTYPYANLVHPTASGMKKIFNEFLYI